MPNDLKPKISILGGSGFVGTSLGALLRSLGTPFEIIDIKKSKQFPDAFKYGDVRDVDSLNDAISGSVVVYLAAVHRDDIKDKNKYQETNVNGAKNVIKVCQQKRINRIIFTSSVAVYGFAEEGANEDSPIRPFNEYGRTKAEAENVLRMWQQDEGNELIIIRPTVIFGEGNRGNVYNLMNTVATGKFIMVGKGENKKSMAYVHNVVAFIETCIRLPVAFGLYNYVDGPDLTMKRLVSAVNQQIHGKSSVGLSIPYWLGLLLGSLADVYSKGTKKQTEISRVRVQKFCSSSSFSSNNEVANNFKRPYSLAQGLQNTLDCEFVHPDPGREIFFTE